MMERKSYFVAVDFKEVREMSIPDNEIEFEIVATPDEVKELEELFRDTKKDGRKAAEYIGKPFDEWGADDKRTHYDEHLIEIYRFIHGLGTAETKERIEQLKLFG
ncbi:hypothetical protein [Virgibacillus siamensis]|uniref:hypothetical protein n=1 Tax=Virgibacillus siamensis TaxID=480071 RepID=UPI000984DE23|nr:hypothetical protein [Virgibacillus siamensis]